jgi:hypothetical protein
MAEANEACSERGCDQAIKVTPLVASRGSFGDCARQNLLTGDSGEHEVRFEPERLVEPRRRVRRLIERRIYASPSMGKRNAAR